MKPGNPGNRGWKWECIVCNMKANQLGFSCKTSQISPNAQSLSHFLGGVWVKTSSPIHILSLCWISSYGNYIMLRCEFLQPSYMEVTNTSGRFVCLNSCFGHATSVCLASNACLLLFRCINPAPSPYCCHFTGNVFCIFMKSSLAVICLIEFLQFMNTVCLCEGI